MENKENENENENQSEVPSKVKKTVSFIVKIVLGLGFIFFIYKAIVHRYGG
ncbi:MAG: hypothetical protein NT010_08795 [Proteobacteria bacterium]|nr:hypothetical protein [Pseudomonadota bacterium]